jgi:hypothetical protein
LISAKGELRRECSHTVSRILRYINFKFHTFGFEATKFVLIVTQKWKTSMKEENYFRRRKISKNNILMFGSKTKSL